MRKLLLIILASSGMTGVHAQLFSSEAVGGALMGTFIGGIVGGDCHHGFSGNGAAIGAGIGLASGAILGEVQRQSYYNSQPYYSYPAASCVQPGYGYAYVPADAYAPVYYTSAPQRPNYVIGGTLVGALAGGLIGVGYDKGWEGAGIGAASGLVLGGLAEYAAQKHEQKLASYPPPQPTVLGNTSAPSGYQLAPQSPPFDQAPIQVAPQTYEPPRYQIADAPRVPDAPTF
ncbi:MAG TPA: hypothetical protein P5205_06380 [Candidatus Paceibacterota bacterium]|nr:hypothetical protein [Verrucomicrobiota bacterium]HSA09982.1 hypothetical protein [Candidatus Paceibacterota bacterium]